MPHRTVFQWGKSHAHPFTVFIGGFVIGVLVTGAVAWAWSMADNSNVDVVDVTVKKASPKSSPSPRATVSPTASPRASF